MTRMEDEFVNPASVRVLRTEYNADELVGAVLASEAAQPAWTALATAVRLLGNEAAHRTIGRAGDYMHRASFDACSEVYEAACAGAAFALLESAYDEEEPALRRARRRAREVAARYEAAGIG